MSAKIFNDSIHGHIEMHPLCVKIIDTPEFQRLRAIRQLGGCYWVYPGAATNRFEHSLGVCYLASQMARHLKVRQPELLIDDKDILCVEIAGLCHDLGHGPFSHMFDRRFMHAINPQTVWTHEQGSVDMFCHLIAGHPELWEAFKAFGIANERDIIFILELFAGPLTKIPSLPPTFLSSKESSNMEESCGNDEKSSFQLCNSPTSSSTVKKHYDIKRCLSQPPDLPADKLDVSGAQVLAPASVLFHSNFKKSKISKRNSFVFCDDDIYHNDTWKYRGRNSTKSFLYEIVANHKTGVDVDKWDYFARDCHHLGLKSSFDYMRLLKFNRVLRDEDGYLTICYKDKEAKNLYDMFYLRDTLHRKAYQHTVACIIELMITEALVLANDHLFYPGKNGKLYRMSEAVNDMEAYSKLTDYVYYQILHSTDPKLAASKNLLERIENRQLFKYIGRINFSSTETTAHLMENVKQEIVEILNDKCIIVKENVLTDPKGLESVNLPRDNSPDDIVLLIVEFDYGMEEKDPMENVRFYSKDNMFEAQKLRKQQVSTMLTDNFAERYLRIYSKSSNPERVKQLKNAFETWCSQQKLLNISCSKDDNLLTPIKLQRGESTEITNGFTLENFDGL